MQASYCAVCDDFYHNDEDRMHHVQQSNKHPYCAPCNTRFLNLNVYRNHLVYSRAHNYCALCEMEFRTPAGLRCHLERAPPHTDDSDDEPDDADEDYSEGWEDRMGLDLYPQEPYAEEDGDNGDHSWMHEDGHDYIQFDSDDEEDSEDEEDGEIGEDEETVTEFACPVCKEAPDVACLTRCGHLYCATCIHQAYRRDSKCPTCKEDGQTSQLRKVYLTTEADD